MAGAVETMAVTPQMLVPAAMSVPRRGGSPSRRLNQVTKTQPGDDRREHHRHAGQPEARHLDHAELDADEDDAERAASSSSQNLRPGPVRPAAAAVLRSSRPMTIATGTPEIGTRCR